MSFSAFLKFALISIDSLSWPLFALGYPLHASIQAIETNSDSDAKKLVTYWVVFSLISLFEHAFMGILQWLPFWPYMKLTIISWTIIPRFDGAFYVYNRFVHPCLNIDVQTIVNWVKKQLEFVSKDDFVAEAEKYVKANGSEALEKLIASKSKCTEPSILQKDIKPVQVTEKREVAPVKLVPEAESNTGWTENDMIKPPEIEGAAGCHPTEITCNNQVQKEWTCALCQVTTTSEKTLNCHFHGRRHRVAREKLMKAKNQPSNDKVSFASQVWVKHVSSASEVQVKHLDVPHKEPEEKHVSSNSAQASQKKHQLLVNPKTETSKSNLPKEEPKKRNELKPSEKEQSQHQSQKKFAEIKSSQFHCTMCNISCTSSGDFNCHLWGRKHLAKIEKLNTLRRGELA